MSDGKVLTYIGIMIAVDTAFWPLIEQHWWLFWVINVVTILGCLLLSYFERKLVNSNHKWIDKLVYKFTKNDFNYVVKQKIVEYSIESQSSAKYSLSAEIKVIRPVEDFHYDGRYVWNQQKEIIVNLHDPKKYRCSTSENLKWSNVYIYPVSTIPKVGDKYTLGFDLGDLTIDKLEKHSFLSCKVVEKIENLKLIACVEPSLHPSKKAIFEVQNYLGFKIAKEEELVYDEETHSYSKTLKCPRKGRKYIIRWEYEKNS